MVILVWICPECRSTYTSPLVVCERDGVEVAEVLAHQTKSRYPLLGEVVGDRYHLIGGLGQGGLGTVYLARHLTLDQLLAVKFLDLSTLGPEISDSQRNDYQRDFLKEARVASLIRHDAVVRVSDFGDFKGLPFLVMEYVPGPSLLQMLANQGRFPLEEALNVVRRIAEALEAFHERRLVHRDLKPANVILDPRGGGRLTLVDLGLVKDISGPSGRASTHPMALRGTPGYLAPEQVPAWVLSSAGIDGGEKQPVTARVDIYALGVIFYELVAGISPYPDGSNTRIIIHACTRDPLPLTDIHDLSVPPAIEALIYETMARDPNQRPASASAFLARLDEITYALWGGANESVERGAAQIGPPMGLNAETTYESEEIFDDDPTSLGAVVDPVNLGEAMARRGAAPMMSSFASPSTNLAANLTPVGGVGFPQGASPSPSAELAARLQRPVVEPPPPAPAPRAPELASSGVSGWLWVLLLIVFLISGGVFYLLKRPPAPSTASTPVILRATPPPLEAQDAALINAQALDAAPSVEVDAALIAEEGEDPDTKPQPRRPRKRPRPRKPVVKKAAPPPDAGPPPISPTELKIQQLLLQARDQWRRERKEEALRLFVEARALMTPAHAEWNNVKDRIQMLKEETGH